MESDTSQNDSTGAEGATGTGETARPATAQAALESAARSAASPAPAPGAGSVGATANTGAPPIAAAAKPVNTRGPIPFPEHEQILRNTRTKAAEEAIQQFAWAQGLNPEEVKDALRIRRQLAENAQGFHERLGTELKGDEFSLPDADLVDKSGRIKSYSDASVGKIVRDAIAHTLRQVDERLRPFNEEREAKQQTEQEERAKEQRKQVLKDELQSLRQFSQFKDNEKAISVKLGEIPVETRRRVGLVTALHMAYNAVLVDVMQQAPAQAETRVLTDLKRKATAATGNANPAGPTPAGGVKKPGNVRELAKHLEHLANAQ